MNNSTINTENVELFSQGQEVDLLGIIKKIFNFRKLLLKACCIGAILGIIMVFSIPKEYTANTLIAPEGYRRSSSSGISALADMADIDISSSSSSSATERDAIYPSLYPSIVSSTPFLIQLFDIKVHEQKDSTIMPLSRYLKERQKRPWWSVITLAPSKLIGWTISLFKDISDENREKTKTKIDPFWLTREEAGMAGSFLPELILRWTKRKRP